MDKININLYEEFKVWKQLSNYNRYIHLNRRLIKALKFKSLIQDDKMIERN